MNNFAKENLNECIELLGELIACDTVNPPGDEFKAAEVVTRFLDKYGIPYKTYENKPGRTNVVATLGNKGRTLLMAAHLDVVPVGDGWDTDPFVLVQKDGKLFGRGTTDDKGPLAGQLLMLKFFALNPELLKCNLVVVASADEERGSAEGLKFLVSKGLVNPDFVVIGDIDGHCLEIDVAEKGVAQFELRTLGKQAHAAVPHEGRNAVYAMCDWINRIRYVDLPFEKHPILGEPSRNIGKISGGIAPNVVPGDCTAILDTRILPNMDPHELGDFLLKLGQSDLDKNPGIRYEVKLMPFLPPTELDPSNTDLSVLVNSIAKVKGKQPTLVGSGGATDCKAFLLKGIPAIAFGPGDKNVAHLANEYMPVCQLEDFISIIIDCAASFK